MSTGDDGQRLARALAFIQRTLELIADDVRQIDSGLVVRSASLPAVWAANQLLISNAPPFAELVALADEQLAERPYRHIQIIDQSAGPQLEQQFRTAGWRIERELLMALEHGPDR